MPDLIARWGRLRRLADGDASRAAREWASVLGIAHELRLERVLPSQVADHSGRRGCSLVGVVWDDTRACIYHTRALTGEDLVHELLHVAHPAWSEAQVVNGTTQVLDSRWLMVDS